MSENVWNELGNIARTGIRAFVDQSPCGGRTDVFFPESTGTKTKRELYVAEAAAKNICRNCVVRVECLNYAITNMESGSVWGGKNSNEREAIYSSNLSDYTTT